MYNEELKWIENALDRLHETGKMGSLHWRATYTEEDQKARKLLEQWMREKDLEVFYDDVGNLFFTDQLVINIFLYVSDSHAHHLGTRE